MPNTTNFGWATPADTDLVKDGAAAIRTLGSSIDTSLVDLKGGTTGQVLSKASNTDMDFAFITPNVGDITEVQAGVGISVTSGTGPIPVITNSSTDLITTAGDLLYGTAADTVARLGIGTAGQVLKVNSGATAPEWGALPSSGLNLIASTSFTNVASQSFDSVFNSTYNNYLVIFDTLHSASAPDDLHLQLRYAGPTTQTTDYYGSTFRIPYSGATTQTGTVGLAHMNISLNSGSSGNPGAGSMYVNLVGNASKTPNFHGVFIDADGIQNIFGGQVNVARVYTGFLLKTVGANITGTVSIYGLAK
jgi:hypothetical protein